MFTELVSEYFSVLQKKICYSGELCIFYSTTFLVIRFWSYSLSLNYFAFLCKLQVADRYSNSILCDGNLIDFLWKNYFWFLLEIWLDLVTLTKLCILIQLSILPVFLNIWLQTSKLIYSIFLHTAWLTVTKN